MMNRISSFGSGLFASKRKTGQVLEAFDATPSGYSPASSPQGSSGSGGAGGGGSGSTDGSSTATAKYVWDRHSGSLQALDTASGGIDTALLATPVMSSASSPPSFDGPDGFSLSAGQLYSIQRIRERLFGACRRPFGSETGSRLGAYHVSARRRVFRPAGCLGKT